MSLKPGTFYVTTFCNFAHRLSDGAPINHECFVLSPSKLRAEMRAETSADFDKIGSMVQEPRRTHSGRVRSED